MADNKEEEKLVSDDGRIKINRDLCIGAATCLAVAPGVFELDDEGKAYIVDSSAVDPETVKLAAESCPTKAIFVYDENGKQIFP